MTAQAPDWIELPDEHVRPLHCLLDIFGPRALRRFTFEPHPTINYRGYTARWRLEDGQLFLKSAGGTVADPGWRSADGTRQCDLTDIHGSKELVFAGWITQDLLIPEPDRLWEAQVGTYLRIPVVNGKAVAEPSLFEVGVSELARELFRRRVVT
ncbi:hypothetical protein [Methylobacterium oxalidis]|uniref:Uncharacterized protein n=1 Tax=Methylobacterium oxalidis TaxID=944322 RepID=A0A512JBM5_9HYPH|nr:hypothetical protein [Methylobacterium oxalidis]GEP07383.1 hypothetical protein MOX02_54210 [Methylobacterium oxalidis]GJE35353.1 hypothetical protein LDDCCGHA_5571 [Methylobacterium oxalidis]GLS67672.1 hypothetical protein GCM10007888_60570 [Methylobacterium oxalidis]